MAGTISTGPRTPAGKARAAANALRHGLAATHRRQHSPAEAVERLALAICGDADDAELFAAARAIAENEFVCSAIRTQKIIAIERLKEATAIALRKGDNSFDLGKVRFMAAWLAYREIQRLIPQMMREHGLPMPPREVAGEIVPVELKALLSEEDVSEDEQKRLLEIARQEIRRRERTEYEALEEAIPDLIRLDRYERQAWSRQRRAVQQLVLIRFSRAMAAAEQMETTRSASSARMPSRTPSRTKSARAIGAH